MFNVKNKSSFPLESLFLAAKLVHLFTKFAVWNMYVNNEERLEQEFLRA